MGRSTQGVKVMNVRNGDTVSAVAVVVESEAELGADVVENGETPDPDTNLDSADGGAPGVEPADGEAPSAEAPDDGEAPPDIEPGNGSPNGSA
jgi:DNA gyrase subunit A